MVIGIEKEKFHLLISDKISAWISLDMVIGIEKEFVSPFDIRQDISLNMYIEDDCSRSWDRDLYIPLYVQVFSENPIIH